MKDNFFLPAIIFVVAVGLIAAYMFAVQNGYATSRIIDSDYSEVYRGLLVNSYGATNGLIVQSGNVGIGTTPTNAKLEVDGAGFAGDTIGVYANNSSAAIYVNQSSSIGTGISVVAANNYFSGNVGIGGTASPGQRLRIKGGNLLVTSGATPVSDSGLRIVAPISDIHYNWMIGAQENVDGGLEITPSTFIAGTNFTSPVAVFKQSGNVGIGTTTPAYKLDINGTARVVNDLSVGGKVRIELGSISEPSYTFINDSNTGMYSPSADTIAFTTNGGQRMRIDNTGGYFSGNVDFSLGYVTSASLRTATSFVHNGGILANGAVVCSNISFTDTTFTCNGPTVRIMSSTGALQNYALCAGESCGSGRAANYRAACMALGGWGYTAYTEVGGNGPRIEWQGWDGSDKWVYISSDDGIVSSITCNTLYP